VGECLGQRFARRFGTRKLLDKRFALPPLCSKVKRSNGWTRACACDDPPKVRRHPVRYLQLAYNEWDPATKTSRPRVLYSFGREDALDRTVIERLVASLGRLLEPGAVLAASAGTGLSFVESRSFGGAWLLDQLWRRLGIDKVMTAMLAGTRRDPVTERVLFALVAVVLTGVPGMVIHWCKRIGLGVHPLVGPPLGALEMPVISRCVARCRPQATYDPTGPTSVAARSESLGGARRRTCISDRTVQKLRETVFVRTVTRLPPLSTISTLAKISSSRLKGKSSSLRRPWDTSCSFRNSPRNWSDGKSSANNRSLPMSRAPGQLTRIR
jgi:hypothetical protein